MINDDTFARHFKALAHPRRAMLFRLLAMRPELGSSQKTLLAAANLPYTSFAHHMAQLESAGLLQRRVQRGSVSYMIAPREFVSVLADALRLVDGAPGRRAATALRAASVRR